MPLTRTLGGVDDAYDEQVGDASQDIVPQEVADTAPGKHMPSQTHTCMRALAYTGVHVHARAPPV